MRDILTGFAWLAAGIALSLVLARINRRTEKCQGCDGRVRRIGPPWATRREAAYCKACLESMAARWPHA